MKKVALTVFSPLDTPSTVDQLLAVLESHPTYRLLHQQLAPGGRALFLALEHRGLGSRFLLSFAATAAPRCMTWWALIDADDMAYPMH